MNKINQRLEAIAKEILKLQEERLILMPYAERVTTPNFKKVKGQHKSTLKHLETVFSCIQQKQPLTTLEVSKELKMAYSTAWAIIDILKQRNRVYTVSGNKRNGGYKWAVKTAQ